MARKTKAREDGPFTNVAAAAALKARWGEGAGRKAAIRADWHSIDPVLVHSLVSYVGELGGAVTLGVDKNKAGYTVTVWLQGNKILNQWYRGDDDGAAAMTQELGDFIEDVRVLLSEQ